MFVLRFVSAALAAFLIGIVAIDMALYRSQPGPVLEYRKGDYLGQLSQTDTAISEETRSAIRQRGIEASAW